MLLRLFFIPIIVSIFIAIWFLDLHWAIKTILLFLCFCITVILTSGTDNNEDG